MAFPNPFRRKPTKTPVPIIARHSEIAGGLGAAGSFAAHSDIILLGGVWTRMIYKLARFHEVPMSWGGASKIAAAISTSALAFTSGFKAANSYFAYTGVGTPAAMAANATVNYSLTYAAGQAASDVFSKDGPSTGKTIATFITAIRDLFVKLAAVKVQSFRSLFFKGPKRLP